MRYLWDNDEIFCETMIRSFWDKKWCDICETMMRYLWEDNDEIFVKRQWWDILWHNDEIFCETKNYAIFEKQWWDICEKTVTQVTREEQLLASLWPALHASTFNSLIIIIKIAIPLPSNNHNDDDGDGVDNSN